MYCTVIDTGVASWTATPIDGLQQQIPSATCADTEQGCYHTSSFWDEANYTQLLTVGIDDPAGSGSKVTCTQIRAVDLSTPNNVSIGAFTMIPWISAMGGATMLLAVYGNQSSTDSEYNYLQMRNYWTFGDVCSGSKSAKIQLIPPAPPGPGPKGYWCVQNMTCLYGPQPSPKFKGGTEEQCAAACDPSLYMCKGGQCVPSAAGGTLQECTQVCRPLPLRISQ
jgi:hypothetical protein